MTQTVIAIESRFTTDTERHVVAGMNAKQTASLIAAHTRQNAIWTGKVIGEWHITDKLTNKVSAIVYDRHH